MRAWWPSISARRRWSAACLWILSTLGSAILAATPPAPLWGDAVDVIKEEGVEAQLVEGREIRLRVMPEKGDGYITLSRRLCDDEKRWPALQEANRSRRVIAGRPIVVPWALLREEYRYLALLALFPDDHPSAKGWIHQPSAASVENYGEGLWQVALWFTGEGENWERIARSNGLPGPDIPAGKRILVPKDLLLPLLVEVERSEDGKLRYEQDAQGPYAAYSLARKEALYSAVVLRFTGLTDPKDVSEAVSRIAERSGIDDVRKIPIGFKVKIPFDLLVTDALPANHPRRIVARITKSELASVSMPKKLKSLAGVHVLLDPGHGGKDLGAIRNGIWESDYVYDIACRMKRLLEKNTGATVHMLVRDTEHGCKVFDRRKLPQNHREVVQTSPRHRNRGGGSTKMGVNLRWYLANSIYARLRKKKVPSEKIVFLSLHADSLHRSLRGGMVYVPGERYRKGRFGVHGGSYRKYQEVKASKRISFSRKERLRDEAVSTRLAQAILEAYRKDKLPVHKNHPIRNHITKRVRRRTRRFAPAVLRANRVPAKVLVETVNINNKADAKLMSDPEGRQRMARAIVRGVESFFSGH